MPFTYTNSKGVSYILHATMRTHSTGKKQKVIYFARDLRDGALDVVPEGFAVFETASGLPMLRAQSQGAPIASPAPQPTLFPESTPALQGARSGKKTANQAAKKQAAGETQVSTTKVSTTEVSKKRGAIVTGTKKGKKKSKGAGKPAAKKKKGKTSRKKKRSKKK